MLKWIRCSLGLALILWLSACGDTKSNSNPIPTATPPTATPTPLPVPQPGYDSRLPDLSRAASVNLSDFTHYTALKDLAHNVFPELVGNPYLQLNLQKNRELEGTALFTFEDQMGFWGAELSSFTGLQAGNQTQIIFADDEFVFKVIAVKSSNDLDGILYYRVRVPGDTACRNSFVTCEPFSFLPPQCIATPDNITPCWAYMNLSSASVKTVGTFKAKYSDWWLP